MSGIYISFDDSSSNPTYTSADVALLVEGSETDDNENPAADVNVVLSAPVLPSNIEELQAFARLQGWGLEFDNEGQAILYTGIIR